eukprot:m.64469 g.64469  ORF g.64469 m.64469 type:complete len:437 (+) comp11485_c0_seq17:31-1341(+)
MSELKKNIVDEGDGRVIVVKKGEELRCEGSEEFPVIVELKSGQAECFGSELVQGRKYTITDMSVAFFTWHGCTFHIKGEHAKPYVSSETNMKTAMNIHAALENLRQSAKDSSNEGEDKGHGPRVLVVGTPGCGRSTLCRILANYSARMYGTPILVDLDTNNNFFNMPGCVSAVPILRSADPVSGFTHEYPLMYHYGHLSPKSNEKRYAQCLDLLAASISEKCRKDETANSSGLIINTPTCTADVIVKAAKTFQCDFILVIDTERLLNQVNTNLKKENMSDVRTILVKKSSGVVPLDEELKKKLLEQRIRRYFYGFGKEMKLNPHSISVRDHSLTIYKIGGREIPLDCLPIGAKKADVALQLERVSPNSPDLLHKVLSVVDCKQDATEDAIKNACVRGFVVLEDYDKSRNTFRISCPSDSFPFSVALLQDTAFIEVV